ncbi:Nrap-domain-containing protein [Ramicandelaber brevisporus]|nr:Nrap-domain-containing protein [Ramicandelaber brevisporus]
MTHHKDEKKKDAKKAPAAPAAPAAAHVAHPAPTKTKSAVKTPAPSHGPPVNPLKRVMAGWNVNVVGGVHRPPPKFRTHKPTATDPKKAKPAPVNVHFIPGFLRPLSNPIVVQRNVPTKKSTGALVPVLVGIAVAIFVMCLCLQCLVHKKVVEESDGVLSGHSSAGVSHYYNNSNSATAARAAGANGANFGPEMSESVGGASSVAARGLGDGVTRRHSNHPAPVSSSMAMSSTSAVTSGNSASNSQGRYSAIANPVSLPEQFEDDREREMHERALAFERAHPFGSVATSITDEQAAHIADYGVAAWEMAVDPAQSSLVSVAERTEITFRNIDADSDPVTVQSNLPIPRNNPVYYFEVKLSSLPRGTTVSVGVSTKPYPLWRMCGWNKHSIGFFTDNGHVYQDNPFKAMPVGERCFEGDILGVGFQPHLGTLFFTRNGRRFRTVITGVHYDLFPTVSVVGGPARVEVNVGQVGFVFIEANVKKWRFAELEGTLSPPPAYGNDRGSILLQIGSSNGQGSLRNENDGAVGSSAESFVSSNSRNVDETTALDPAYADALAIASANSRPRSEAYDALAWKSTSSDNGSSKSSKSSKGKTTTLVEPSANLKKRLLQKKKKLQIAESDSESEGFSLGEEDTDEEGEDSDIDEDDARFVQHSSKSSASRANGGDRKYIPPTHDELDELNENVNSKSGLFRLQIEELAKAMHISSTLTGAIERYVNDVRTVLQSASAISPLPAPAAASHFLKKSGDGIAVPYPPGCEPARDAMYTFAFERPTKVSIVGSLPLETTLKAKDGFNVDVAVRMPDSLLQEKDHVNYRYTQKRAFYLAGIASELESSFKKGKLGQAKMEFAHVDENELRPIITLHFQQKKKSSESDQNRDLTMLAKHSVVIRLFVEINVEINEDGLFNDSIMPLNKLSPERNNVRQSNQQQQQQQQHQQKPTPLVNSAILQDCLMTRHMEYLKKTANSCSGFRQACVLGSVWLKQRGFVSSGINGFIFAMVLAYLLNTTTKIPTSSAAKKESFAISREFTSYQLFRGVVRFLALSTCGITGRDASNSHSDGDVENVLMFNEPSTSKDSFQRQHFANNFDAVFVDPEGKLNLFAFIGISEINRLKYEAKIAMEMLDDSNADRFAELFLLKINHFASFDEIAGVTLPSNAFVANHHNHSGKDTHNGHVHKPHSHIVDRTPDYTNGTNDLCSDLHRLLVRGLTSRVHLVSCLPSSNSVANWSVTSTRPSQLPSNTIALSIGLIFDQSEHRRLVDKGPNPDADPIASNVFKSLWGEKKVDLRRFKDGSIVEAVVWDAKIADDRSHICARIVSHLVNRHVSTSNNSNSKSDGKNDGKITIKFPLHEFASASRPIITSKNAINLRPFLAEFCPARHEFQPLIKVFNEFARHVRTLENLPLEVTGVYPSSAPLRYASATIPSPAAASTENVSGAYIEPMYVVLQLEESSQWPDDLAAIQKVKTAMYIALGKELESNPPPVPVGLPASHLGPFSDGKHSIVKASVVSSNYGVSDGVISVTGHLDVLIAPGYLFRCRIHYPREPQIIRRILNSNKFVTLPAALQPQTVSAMASMSLTTKARSHFEHALQVHESLFTRSVYHTAKIAALVQKYPALSSTIRIVKKWLSSHMVLGGQHLSEEAAELICASVFTSARMPYGVPMNGAAGAIRVLELLSGGISADGSGSKKWNWIKGDALIVDLDEEPIDAAKRAAIEKAVQAANAAKSTKSASASVSGDDFVLRISTPQDPLGTWWTGARAGEAGPTKIVAARLRQLASASLSCIQQYGFNSSLSSDDTNAAIRSVFKTPLSDYDFVIHLRSSMCLKMRSTSAASSQKTKSAQSDQVESSASAIYAGFDFVQSYLHQLCELYGKSVYFFADTATGSPVIAGVWIPNAPTLQAAQQLRVNALSNVEPSGDKTVQPNKKAMIVEMARLGRGLVDRIVLSRKQ